MSGGITRMEQMAMAKSEGVVIFIRATGKELPSTGERRRP
jgi:hypothetical protein